MGVGGNVLRPQGSRAQPSGPTALDRSTAVTDTFAPRAPGAGSPARSGPPERLGAIDGRFDVVTLVKRGRGINTYTGVDHLGETDVIIKAVETANMLTAVCMRLEHEARVLEQPPT